MILIGPWQEGWIVVHTSHLRRTDKTALRARERAFRLNGFAEFVTGLWCRPDNLARTSALTREALLTLGLEPAAVVMQCSAITGVDSRQLFQLWPREQLEAGYREAMRAMEDSAKRLPGMGRDDAARETFQVGEAVIRRINEDSLLPEQMVHYNTLGRSAWAEFGTGFGM